MKKWLLGVGGAIIASILASAIYDFIRDRQIFSTILSVLTNALDAVVTFFRLELRVWWVLLFGLLLLVVFYVYKKEKKKKEIEAAELLEKLSVAENKIKELTTQPDNAFYESIVEIKYHSLFSSYLGAPAQRSDYKKTVKLSEVFSIISMEMLDVAVPEDNIRRVLENKLIRPSNGQVDYSRYYFTDPQLIKHILNQLKAFKLILSKWDDSTKKLYWGVTTKGKKVRDDITLTKISGGDVESSG